MDIRLNDKTARTDMQMNDETARIDIRLNGETARIDAGCTLAQLLETRQLAQRRVAVEVNAAIIPRGQHAGHRLHAGDVVEIVHALGGG